MYSGSGAWSTSAPVRRIDEWRNGNAGVELPRANAHSGLREVDVHRAFSSEVHSLVT